MEGFICWECKENVGLNDILQKNYVIDQNYLNELHIFHTLCHEEWLNK